MQLEPSSLTKPPTNQSPYDVHHNGDPPTALRIQPQPDAIPIESLTHLNYAFANIDASGQVVLGDSYADTDKAYPGDSWDPAQQAFRGTFWQINKKLKQRNPNLKTLISIGGWTWSGRFSDAAVSDASRKLFAKTAADFVNKYGFDGKHSWKI